MPIVHFSFDAIGPNCPWPLTMTCCSRGQWCSLKKKRFRKVRTLRVPFICLSVCVCVWCPENVKVFAVFCHEYGYTNHLFRKNGGWRLVLCSFKKKYLFNGFYGSLDLGECKLQIICVALLNEASSHVNNYAYILAGYYIIIIITTYIYSVMRCSCPKTLVWDLF